MSNLITDNRKKIFNSYNEMINNAEDYALDGEEVKRICNGKVRVMFYEQLENTHDIDSVLAPFGAVILLYRSSEGFGHFVALLKTGENELEFFDPLGFGPDELTMLEYHSRIHNDTRVKHLTFLINNSNYRLKVNNKRIQQFNDHTNTCGRHASVRVRMRNYTLEEYIKWITSKDNKQSPDFIVSSLTIMV